MTDWYRLGRITSSGAELFDEVIWVPWTTVSSSGADSEGYTVEGDYWLRTITAPPGDCTKQLVENVIPQFFYQIEEDCTSYQAMPFDSTNEYYTEWLDMPDT